MALSHPRVAPGARARWLRMEEKEKGDRRQEEGVYLKELLTHLRCAPVAIAERVPVQAVRHLAVKILGQEVLEDVRLRSKDDLRCLRRGGRRGSKGTDGERTNEGDGKKERKKSNEQKTISRGAWRPSNVCTTCVCCNCVCASVRPPGARRRPNRAPSARGRSARCCPQQDSVAGFHGPVVALHYCLPETRHSLSPFSCPTLPDAHNHTTHTHAFPLRAGSDLFASPLARAPRAMAGIRESRVRTERGHNTCPFPDTCPPTELEQKRAVPSGAPRPLLLLLGPPRTRHGRQNAGAASGSPSTEARARATLDRGDWNEGKGPGETHTRAEPPSSDRRGNLGAEHKSPSKHL